MPHQLQLLIAYRWPVVEDNLFIPKKLWLRTERRFMTFREILVSGAGRFLIAKQYEDLDIEAVENTSEEISRVAVEMDERLRGRWEEDEDDDEMQRRFWALFERSDINAVFKSRIGAEFLRENRNLLD